MAEAAAVSAAANSDMLWQQCNQAKWSVSDGGRTITLVHGGSSSSTEFTTAVCAAVRTAGCVASLTVKVKKMTADSTCHLGIARTTRPDHFLELSLDNDGFLFHAEPRRSGCGFPYRFPPLGFIEGDVIRMDLELGASEATGAGGRSPHGRLRWFKGSKLLADADVYDSPIQRGVSTRGADAARRDTHSWHFGATLDGGELELEVVGIKPTPLAAPADEAAPTRQLRPTPTPIATRDGGRRNEGDRTTARHRRPSSSPPRKR